MNVEKIGHPMLRCIAAFAAMWISTAIAQTSTAQVSGAFGATGPSGDSLRITFTCTGIPTCAGTFTMTEKDAGCSNSFTFTNSMVFNGLDLSHPGAFSGTLDLAAETNSNILSNGTCSYAVGAVPKTHSFTGAWDGTKGTIVVQGHNDDGSVFDVPGTFTSNIAPPPVFPMTVSANVTPTVSSVSANIQPRSQDTGNNASIYVFAHAPSNLVSGALQAKRGAVAMPDDGAIVCVLAQVDANGHLTAVSASTMQAYLTGVLTSQSQSVQILNNVATPNVAGASMFVGYGSSAASMLASGVFQSAVNVPGAVQCTASLASAPAATTPAALSGLWWNAAESGWGIHFTQRGAILFAAWYTYDAQGNPKWYVAPNCPFSSSNAVSGNCTSALYEVAGTAFFGHDFNPDLFHPTQVGTLQLSFQNTNAASMTYTVGTQTRTVAIVRQIFLIPATSPPAVDFTDLWWNPSESGWGMAMAHQFGNVFLAWYVYDGTGKPFWYVAPACTVSGSSCSGALYRTTGPAFGPPLDPNQVHAFAVGSAIVSFVDANNAVLSFTVDGVTATKTITRQLF
jgi:hypothetical protein